MSNKNFHQNSCRICLKVFCCEECRKDHELKNHNVHSECDICIRGKILLKDPSESLLQHIRENHWPLHCIHCERIFDTVNDIFIHNKCPKSMLIEVDNDNNNTPPTSERNFACITTAGQSCVPTSTPVAPRENENEFLQKMTETITPVDVLQKKEIENKSVFTPSNCSEKRNDQYTKRRVTFSNTVEEITDNENIQPEKTNEPLTPSSQQSLYITAEMKTPTLSSINETDEKDFNEGAILQLSMAEDETLWETAINDFEEVYTMDKMVTKDETVEEHCITYWPIASDESESSISNQTNGLWNSMTNIFKNVIQSISTSQEESLPITSLKRRYASPDHEDGNPRESPVLKRMKFTDIKCRRPIRYMKPALFVRYGKLKKVPCAHKLTQTD